MKRLLRDVYDDLANGRLSQREALERIKALKVQENGRQTGTLLATPVWLDGAGEAFAGSGPVKYADHHVIVCEPWLTGVVQGGSLSKDTQLLSLQSDQSRNIALRYSEQALVCFERIRTILQSKPLGKVLVQIVAAGQQEQALFAGLSGLLATAALENPNVVGQLILVTPEVTADELSGYLQYEKSRWPDRLIRYEHGARQVLRWQEVPVDPEPPQGAFEDHGVYLITGGLGGVGALFAKEILDRTKARVVLAGRSVLSAEKRALLGGLSSQAGRVSYRQMDVSDPDQVTRVIAAIGDEYGRLDGVLHCAGLIADNFIMKKEVAEFSAVLAPKVAGTFNLDHATRNIELDFFVLFSSYAGALGNVGQADYAAANGFMDHFAAYRNRQVALSERYGRTRSINWPLWQSGGMGLDPASRERLEQATGIHPMQTATGLSAFYRSLALPYDQILAAEGDLAQMRLALFSGRPIEPDSAPLSAETYPVPLEADNAEAGGSVIEKTRAYLRRECSEVLKVPYDEIDPQAALEQYGIESILALKLTSHLEGTFGPLSKTLFFEYQTIAALSEYFVQSHAARLAALFASPGPVDTSPEAAPQAPLRRDTQRRFPRSRATPGPAADPESIAVIGLSGRYPEAVDIDSYWRNLRDGRDCITEVPQSRWDWQAYFSADRTTTGNHFSKWGGFISGVDEFDPMFFNISPKEAKSMDPQERLFLQHAWMAVEDAGYTRASLQVPCEQDLPGQVGVYVGVMYTEYQLFGAEASVRGQRLGIAGSPASIANRVSYALNLHGPSVTLDTMCSSSLTAIHFACQDLKLGRTGLAIAGGVNVSIHPNKYLVLSSGQFISSDGHCQSFGEGGDGYIPGEGVGVVVLKRLSEAKRDGDHIYGVIRGSALNHGGKTNGYTVPNPLAQASVISRALAESGTDPRHISYIEAHGTGTELGDPIEITALNKAFQRHTQETEFCLIGSAKSNIGHCESAAGIAGLTKVLLQMQYQQIVPSLHSAQLNPHIDFPRSPFIVNQTLRPWEQPVIEGRKLPRIAGISSFGAGGSNAHMIVEEYQPPTTQSMAVTSVIILLSARTVEQLQQRASDLLEFLRARMNTVDLAAMSYTLQTGREAMEERLGFVVGSVEQLADKLQAYLAGDQAIGDVYQGQVKRNKEALSVFRTDADLQQTVDKWIAGRKLFKLLDLWVKGLELDWSKLYGETTPRRLSLPTYPFARERYWIETMAAGPVSPGAASTSALHPLLHRNTSDLSHQSYSSTFSGEEVFLRDHQVDGQRTLPAAAYLEMARIAVQTATSAPAEALLELRDVVWAQPITVSESKQISIALFPNDGGRIDYEIYSRHGDQEIIHCQGRAVTSYQPQPGKLDIEKLKAQMDLGNVERDAVYAACARMGLVYGSPFQAITAIHQGSNQLLAELRLPSIVEDNAGDYVLHPGLIAGALQACVVLRGNWSEGSRQFRYLSALESLRIVSPCTQEMVAWVRYAPGSRSEDHVVNLDIDLCDERGTVCVQMRGVRWQQTLLDSAEPVLAQAAYSAAPVVLTDSSHDVPGRKELVFVARDPAATVSLERKKPAAISLAAPSSPLPVGASPGGAVDKRSAGRSLISLTNATAMASEPHGAGPDGSPVRLYDDGDGIFSIQVTEQAGNNITAKELISHLRQALDTVRQDASTKVLMLTGIEGCFRRGGREEYNEAAEQNLYEAIVSFPYPLIAVLQGDAIGPAFLAAALCDFMVCNEDASYGYTNVPAAFYPTVPEAILFTERFGAAQAEDFLYTSTTVTGRQLRSKGWTCPILPVAQVEEHAKRLAASLAMKPQDALRLLKQHLARHLVGLVRELKPVEVEAPPTKSSPDPAATTIVSPSEHIHLDASLSDVLVIRFSAASERVAAEKVMADLGVVFAETWQSANYKAIVLVGLPGLLLGTEPAIDGAVLLEFQRLVTESRIPVIAALDGDARGNAWLVSQFCDVSVYSGTAVYSSSGIEYGAVTAQTAAAVFRHRFGNSAGREILLTGGDYRGIDLQERVGTLIVADHDHVLSTALQVASSWAKLPRATLAAWKTLTSVTLQGTVRNLPADGEQTDERPDLLPAVPIAIPLRSRVVTAIAHPEGIVVVKMEDREAKNMASDAFMEGLIEVFAHIDQTPSYKVVVLTGYDNYFASGGTKDSLLAIQAGKARFTDSKIFQLPLDCRLPVIAAVQGHAIGAGWSMAMFADMVLLSEESHYVSPYMDYGFTPGAGATSILADKIGPDLARESLLTARSYAGRELKERGIPLRVLPREEVYPAAMELAQQMARAPRSSLTALKRQLTGYLHEPMEETYRLELAMHDETFVGRSDTLAQIQKKFHQELDVFPAVAKSAHHEPANAVWDSDALPPVMASLRALLAAELQLRESDIDDDAQFVDLGLDSIGGVSWIRKINEKFGTTIEATKVYSFPTLAQLGRYVREEAERNGTLSSQGATPLALIVNRPPSQKQIAAELPAETLTSWRNRTGSRFTSAPEPRPSDPIAIIGMAGQFPQARNLDEFWRNIAEGRNCISQVPRQRWDVNAWYQPGDAVAGKTNSQWLGALEEYDLFDPLFFNISPAEAESIDPQQRLFLQACWHSIENAGYDARSLSGSRCGVFAGCAFGDYHLLSREQQISAESFTGDAPSILAARASYFLNLQGPCVAIDTACSSSLVAIAQACDSLTSGGSDLALAGGVYVMAGPEMHIRTSQVGMLSPEGKCFTFDQRADGLVPGEGVGVVMLKRLTDAQRDQDVIYGVIQGWGVNQDGKTNGITAPNPESQTRLEQYVYDRYQIDPAGIQLIEAHGTGTKLGDPIEVEGLKKAFQKYTRNTEYCALGSVKSNIGHCLTAAGIAGVIKLLLALKHRQLPPTINFERLNEHIDLTDSPFYINSRLQEWKLNGAERRQAAVSSFGFSGTNAHIVIGEYLPPAEVKTLPPFVPQNTKILIPLSARTAEQLGQKARDLLDVVREDALSIDLSGIAYTLQVGRAAMDERVGFVVSSVDQLTEKLTAYVNGEPEINDVHRGRVKRGNESLSIISQSDEIKNTIIDNLIAGGKLSKLLELWVNGLELDWRKLYGETRPRRVSLPVYPFAKERYWIDTRAGKPGEVGKKAHAGPVTAVLHPLLHSNTSDLSQQRYSATFSGEEFFLSDHQVRADGGPMRKVLPGVAYLEMARAAIEHAMPERPDSMVLELRNTVWVQPIIVSGNTEVGIALVPNDGDEIDYEIFSEGAEQEIVHCQGRAVLSRRPSPAALDLGQLAAQMGDGEVEPGSVYAAFLRMGLIYGPSFQAITAIHRGDNRVLAHLRLPTIVEDTWGDYVLHPSLMDGALQACVGLIDGSPGRFTQPRLPFALDALRIVAPCSPEMVAWVRYAPGSQKSDSFVKLDIDLCDERGNICVQMHGLSMRVLSKENSPIAPQHETIGSLLATPVWQAGDAATIEEGRFVYAEHHVVLCEQSISGEQLESLLPHTRCLSLNSGQQRTIAQRYSDHALACFELIETILRGKPQGKVLVQIVVPDHQEQSLFAGLSALLKTAALENPHFAGQLIMASPEMAAEELAGHLRKEKPRALDTLIRYEQGSRQVLRWQELPEDQTRPPIVFRDHGVYLLTGGLGGLGLLFAEEILSHTRQATIVLTGRSAVTSEKQVRLDALAAQGGRVAYRQADVGDLDQVQRLIAAINDEYGQLNGVLHSAGLLADNFILKKASAEFSQVLAPKVTGTFNLDQASRDVELDFFVLFSSLAGAVGNPGQSDYATANGFMDQFAAYRNRQVAAGQRHGRTRSINWSLWQAGGMKVDPVSQELVRQSTGVQPMQTATGMAAFYRSLALPYDQVLAVEGDPARMRRALLGGAEAPLEQESDAPLPVVNMDSESLAEKTQDYLRKQLSGLLKLPSNNIDPQAALETYGIDSILAMKLTSQLEKTFGALSKTLFFEYQTIRELAKYFIQSHAARLATLFAMPDDGDRRTKPVDTRSQTPPSAPAKPVQGRRFGRRVSVTASTRVESEPIAIIGLSGRYPEAVDVDAYWHNLRDGKDCITEVPRERWDWQAYFSDDPNQSGRHHSKWGGFIAGVDEFDPLFFNISPRDAKAIDPQERLFLQHAWMAVEDAGYTRASLQIPDEQDLASQVGVYVGVMYTEYQLFGVEASARGKRLAIAGSAASIANRVSYAFNLHGPSMTLDTMCSSSLTAIHLACQDLKQGRTSMAIAGGVNVSVHPNKYLLLSAGQFISGDGHCQSFGEGGDGYIPGEGVGVVVLKRLSEAKRDGDHIYGIIRGSALNHGGKTNGYSVPNPPAQTSAIWRALAESQVDARQISYIEAHGTGTKLGDPIEIAALSKAFRRYTQDTEFCLIGSAKSNIGHCESAAGMAGLTKVLLQMQHRQIVPSLHSARLNPHIDFPNSPFVVNQTLRTWEQPVIDGRTLTRIAGISSFGAGGSNAHMIVEEYQPPVREPAAVPAVVVLLSARTAGQLQQRVRDLLEFVSPQLRTIDLVALAFTLQVGREAMDERLGFIVSSAEQLVENLQAYVAGQQGIEEVWQGQVSRNREALSVFSTDADLQQTIDKWIVNRKLSKLLELWVKGLELDWSKLYGEVRPQRVSLPTYPFARERYWIDIEAGQSVAAKHAATAVLHPLLHSNTSDLNEQRYRSTFTGDEFFLADHQVLADGGAVRNVLPAVAYLEMARAAIENAQPVRPESTVLELCDTEWAQPAVAGDNRQISVVLSANGVGEIDFEIYSHDTDEDIVHCQGRAAFRSQPPLAQLDLEQLRSNMRGGRVEPGTLYEAYSRMGFIYGPSFQGITAVDRGQGQLLAQLRLPKTLEHTSAEYVLHPSLMDGALQACMGLFDGSAEHASELRLPFAVESLRILSACCKEMVAWVRHSPGIHTDDVVSLDIDLCDEQGNICVQMRGVRWQQAVPGQVVARAASPAVPAGKEQRILAVREPKELAFISQAQATPALTERSKPAGISLAAPGAVVTAASSGRPAITLADTTPEVPIEREAPVASAVRLQDRGDGMFAIQIAVSASGQPAKDVITHLLLALDRVRQEASLKVLAISGIEHCFLRGGREDYNEAVERRLYQTIVSFPYPVIAVLQADVIGAGFLLAALCDFMVCNEDAHYGYTDAQLLLSATNPEAALLRERFGEVRAQNVLYRSSASTGKQLLTTGWTCPIVPGGQVEPYARELAATLSTKPQDALRLLKQHLARHLAALVTALAPVDADDVPAPESQRDDTVLKAIVLPAHTTLLEKIHSLPAAPDTDALPATPAPIALQSSVVTATAHPGGIVVVRMEDRQAKNMFSADLIDGLSEIFAHIEQAPAYKVVVLTGYGHYFAAGGTKDSLLAIQAGRAKFTDSRIFQLPLDCKLPVIAAMQGHGIGAGWSLGMFADVVLLSEESRYVSPYMSYGFTPGAGATWVLPDRIGLDLARESLLTAHPYTGRELKARGLQLPILPRGEVLPAAMALAEQIAQVSRPRLIGLKQQVSQELRQPLEETYRLELAMHEETLVGQSGALAQIHTNFHEEIEASAASGQPVPAEPATRSSDRSVLPAVAADLKMLLANELQMQESEIDDNAQFVDLGLDSISGVTWIRKINEKYQISIEATKVYSFPTLAQLSRYVKAEAEAHGTLASPGLPAAGDTPVVSASSDRALSQHAIVAGRPLMTRRGRSASRFVAGASSPPQSQPIAVIGMAGQFPQAGNVDEFWRNIAEGRNCITQVPRQRWDANAFYQPGDAVAGKTNSQWLGALEGYDLFDPLFFNISPTEAESMDPQQRLFLQACWHSIENAGYDAGTLSGSRCGVFAGCATSDYHQLSRTHQLSAHGFTGSATSILAARISYFLNLQGPCVSIDTACSSSLVAIAQACDSLTSGVSDLALAGGVYVMAGPEMHIRTSQAGMLSPEGKCFTFDQRADGFVTGEGVGVVVLKRLADAQKDQDVIYGVIQGWGVNQDGKTNGITAPNPESQTRLEQDVYDKYQIDPSGIQLIETHGTGTKLGDPIEVEGLKKAFQKYTRSTEYCALGSVKSNIGHCLTAAGIAGVIKLLLALKHRQLPPTINFERLNEHIDLTDSPFYINSRLQEWKLNGAQRRQAAVSSFGFSGTNAHIVIGEYLPPAEVKTLVPFVPPNTKTIIPLSARTMEQLTQRAADLLDFIRNEASSAELSEIAYTLQVGRAAMDERVGFIVSSVEQLAAKLAAYVHGEQRIEDTYRGQVKRNKEALSLFTADDDLQETIDKWIARRKLPKLLDLWVKGLELDWSRLYGEVKPQRVSLPVYPFAKERYWIDTPAIGLGVALPSSAKTASWRRVVSRALLGAGRRRGPSSHVLSPAIDPTDGHGQTIGHLLATPVWQASEVEATAGLRSIEYAEHYVVLCELKVNAEELGALVPHSQCLLLDGGQHASIAWRYSEYALACFEHIQTILQSRPQRRILFQIVVPDHQEQVLLAGLSGLLKTAALENPKFIGQLLLVPVLTTAEELAGQLQAEKPRAVDTLIRYAEGSRQVLRWQEVIEERQEPPLAFQDDGVYLITGGLGGLGTLFVKEILGRTRSRVVLTGRSELSAASQARLDELTAEPGRLRYRRVDLGDLDQVTPLIAAIREEYGQLNGILHCAGMLAENFILDKGGPEFSQVLEPKVTGTFNLDQASRDVELDFFVLFSSIAAVMGNPRTADYAAANGFLDQFAAYRNRQVAARERRGLTRSINWPVWQAGGMGIDQASQERLTQATGMLPMQTATGLHAFYRSLALPHDQLLVVEGIQPKITSHYLQKARISGSLSDAVTGQEQLQTRVLEEPTRTQIGLDQLLVRLRGMLAKVLRIEASNIDLDQAFVELGVDSFLGTELVIAINKEYGTELSHISVFDYPTVRELARYLEHEMTMLPVDAKPSSGLPVTRTPLPAGSRASLKRSLRIRRTATRSQASSDDKVAIIGMSGRYPQAANLQQYWENLVQGRNSIVEVPPSRWDVHQYYDPDPTKSNKANSKWLGVVDDIDCFDPLFFRISPQEADYIDPHHRLFLQESYRAFEDAGYSSDTLANRNCGVYLGISSNEYALLLAKNKALGGAPVTSNHPAIAAARIAYYLNLKGPAISVDTACSSSLVAIHLACQGLLGGETDMALAGGVALWLTPESFVSMTQAGMLSAVGQCKAFDDLADGIVVGDGVGALVLKRLKDAEADNDFIYGVILGSGVNQDGKTNGITAPSVRSQIELERTVYSRHRIDPETITYVETHGTGTKLGDPIELEALSTVFKEKTTRKNYCGLGSVKSNIGHTTSAAGVASVQKVLLSMRHRTLVPTLNVTRETSHFDFEGSPFYLVRERQAWDAAPGSRRRAAVSSFGFSGTNAHLVIEEYPTPVEQVLPLDEQVPFIVPLSARTAAQLRQRSQDLLLHLRTAPRPLDLASVAYTLQTGREAMEERVGFVVSSIDQLADRLSAYVNGEKNIEGVHHGHAESGEDGVTAIGRDDDMQEAIDKWIARGKLSKLLDLWVRGLRFDWNKLYDGAKPQRISLPAYPFARERYWIDETPSVQSLESQFKLDADMKSIEDIINQIGDDVIDTEEAVAALQMLV